MRDLSILIPARCEEWLKRTVEDALKNKRANTEIIVICDGDLPMEPLDQHPDVSVVLLPESIGQRAATNLAARLSSARYVMKADAHVSFAPGFDRVLIDSAQDLGWNTVQIPLQRNLHIYSWQCHNPECGYGKYQGPTQERCPKCNGPIERVIYWQPKGGSSTSNWRLDHELRFQYWDSSRNKGDIADVMTSLGACFFMTREWFEYIEGLDERTGIWGQFGAEVALKTWTAGGRHVVNRRTHFSHFFRVGGIGFPYKISASDQEYARNYSRNMWLGNLWPKQIRPLSWVIDKFAPIPGWHDASGAEVLDRVTRKGLVFSNTRAVADLTEATRAATGGASLACDQVSGRAVRLSPVDGADGGRNIDVVAVGDQIQVDGVAAKLDLALMVNNEPMKTGAAVGHRLDEPGVHQPVHQDHRAGTPAESELPIAGAVARALPEPAAGIMVDDYVGKDAGDGAPVQMANREILGGSHSSASCAEGRLEPVRCDQHRSGSLIVHPRKTSGIVYYTDNRVDERIGSVVREHIEASGLPIVSVALKPQQWPTARTIVLEGDRGYLQMFRQILAGLEALDTDYAFLCEHDVAYHISHFAFTPPRDDQYFYNLNVWKVDTATGRAVTYETKQTSGLCANRQLLIAHYRERVRRVEAEGFSRRIGFEPGSHRRPERIDDVTSDVWRSAVPNVDIRHTTNLTKSRWSTSEFRDQRNCKGWREADAVPGWPGKTLGRFWDWLEEQRRAEAAA